MKINKKTIVYGLVIGLTLHICLRIKSVIDFILSPFKKILKKVWNILHTPVTLDDFCIATGVCLMLFTLFTLFGVFL